MQKHFGDAVRCASLAASLGSYHRVLQNRAFIQERIQPSSVLPLPSTAPSLAAPGWRRGCGRKEQQIHHHIRHCTHTRGTLQKSQPNSWTYEGHQTCAPDQYQTRVSYTSLLEAGLECLSSRPRAHAMLNLLSMAALRSLSPCAVWS